MRMGWVAATAAAALMGTPGGAAAAVTGDTELVSRDVGGGSADHVSYGPDVSADGRWVAFTSYASDLVPGPVSGWSDVYVRDRLTGRTHLVSADVAGAAANAGSALPSISADGRWVAFHSDASDLVPGDRNGVADVFVRDLLLGRTYLASVTGAGAPARAESTAPSISDDGSRVAFVSFAALVAGDRNGAADVYVRDLAAGTTVRASAPAGRADSDGASLSPAISGDGSTVAFASLATNLVPDDTNGVDDVFVTDLATRVVTRASVRPGGAQATGFSSVSGLRALSRDGRMLVLVSADDALVAGDGDGLLDVFALDRVTGTYTRLTEPTGGGAADGFHGLATISRDGRWAGFASDATNLVRNDGNGVSDVFLRDLVTGTTVIATLDPRGGQADGPSDWPAVADGGAVVGFSSSATDLGGTGTDPYGDPLTHVYVRTTA